MIVMVTMMKMMVTCVMVDIYDEHLGHTTGPPYSFVDLSWFGIRSTSSTPIYYRRHNQKKTLNMNDNVFNAYLDNAKYIWRSSLEMEDLPPNPKHKVDENPKPKANRIHSFCDTTSFIPVVPFKENPLSKKR